MQIGVILVVTEVVFKQKVINCTLWHNKKQFHLKLPNCKIQKVGLQIICLTETG